MAVPLLASAHRPSPNKASVGELPPAWRAGSPRDYAKWSSLMYGFEPVEDVFMGRKKHTAEEIVAKLRQVDVLVSQGRKVAEAIRSIEVTRSRITVGVPSTAA